MQQPSCYSYIAQVWQVSLDEYAILNSFFPLYFAECDQRRLACHVAALFRQSSHTYTDMCHSLTGILPSITGGSLSSCVYVAFLCFCVVLVLPFRIWSFACWSVTLINLFRNFALLIRLPAI